MGLRGMQTAIARAPMRQLFANFDNPRLSGASIVLRSHGAAPMLVLGWWSDASSRDTIS